MRYANLALAALFGMSASAAASAALAQSPTAASQPQSTAASNIVPADTRSTVAPSLPGSGLGAEATAHDYLKAARDSLVAGRTGQAQQSMEMAETRALDRSVPQGQGEDPSDSQFIAHVRDARHALGDGDSGHAIQLIDLALSS